MADPDLSKDGKPVGLRERKKQRTRWAIQEHALRLFAERGYEATTVEQIAAAAEISPSTFFRYFRTKEDVVIEDEYDPVIIEVIKHAPAELTQVGAMRHVLHAVFDEFTPAEYEKIVERTRLTFTVPALRARVLESLFDTIDLMAAALAERAGRPTGDFATRMLTGALVGMWMVIIEEWLRQGAGPDLADRLGRALDAIEHGGFDRR